MLNKLSKKYKNYWQLYLLLLLPVVYIIIFAYVPILGLQIAFKKYDFVGGIWGSPYIGLYNFKKFFNSYLFGRLIKNTITLSLYRIIAGFPFPIILALMLNSLTNMKLKIITQTITYMPHFISMVVVVGMMIRLFHPVNGIYGNIMTALTGEQPTDLFANPKAFKHLYTWSGIWKTMGWSSIIYLAALSAVNPELHEAAEVDGASRLKRVWHIDLPSIIPTIIIMLILSMGQVMTVGFQKVLLMQNDLNKSASDVISTYVYKQGLASGSYNDYSYATAIGLFNSIINLVIIIVFNQIAKRVSEVSLW